MKSNNYSLPRSIRGAGLLEVMIAAIILGLGLLGVAALQISALQGSTAADHRTRAIDLGSTLADRIRANLVEHDKYLFAPSDDCTFAGKVCSMVPDGAAVKEKDTCDQDEVAAYDLWELRCRNGIKDTLPGGTLEVTCGAVPCDPGSVFTVTIKWEGVDADEDDTTLVMDFIPRGAEK